MDIDRLLIVHCAPTLAGLKIAALICVEQGPHYEAMVAAYNERYNPRGLYFMTLGSCKQRRLLYVYRKCDVQRCLLHPEVQAFLVEYGYSSVRSVEGALAKLASRFAEADGFPHELGIFLGYPLEDVKAFIQHKGDHAKYCGEWKVYTDVHYAKGQFSKYEKCRRCYVDMFDRGVSMERLIIA